MSVDERRELLEVAAHADDLVVDQRLLALEVLGAETALRAVEHLLVHPDEVVDRGLDRRVALRRTGLGRLAQQLLDRDLGHRRLAPRHDERDHHRRDQRGDDHQSEHHHQGFHRNASPVSRGTGSTVNRGCDSNEDARRRTAGRTGAWIASREQR